MLGLLLALSVPLLNISQSHTPASSEHFRIAGVSIIAHSAPGWSIASLAMATSRRSLDCSSCLAYRDRHVRHITLRMRLQSVLPLIAIRFQGMLLSHI